MANRRMKPCSTLQVTREVLIETMIPKPIWNSPNPGHWPQRMLVYSNCLDSKLCWWGWIVLGQVYFHFCRLACYQLGQWGSLAMHLLPFSKRTQEQQERAIPMLSAFPISLCITFAFDSLVKSSYLATPWLKSQENRSYLVVGEAAKSLLKGIKIGMKRIVVIFGTYHNYKFTLQF